MRSQFGGAWCDGDLQAGEPGCCHVRQDQPAGALDPRGGLPHDPPTNHLLGIGDQPDALTVAGQFFQSKPEILCSLPVRAEAIRPLPASAIGAGRRHIPATRAGPADESPDP